MENYITEIDICDESKDSFLTYAAEVLTDRAIPAAEDGLLSAQRKLIWTMEDYLKMNNSGKTKKCNAIVGSTLATSYFHGDASCYGVLCKMSQNYLMRYPLVQGQGSLGTQENNDMVASSRYTEAKPSEFADIMMEDFKKNIVPLKETYNGEFMEPVVLPSLFPNAICNGRQAIGISMSHNSLPHNLKEVCDGIIAYIKNNDLTIDELMEHIKGPDLPLPNLIINKDAIRDAFATGHSKESLKIRGLYKVEGNKIIFYTIPYRAYRNKIKEQIEKNVDIFENVLEDFNDESSLGENNLIFTLKKDASVQFVLNKLFSLTDLQTSISYNMNYIVNGTPKMCSMIDLIKAYVNHQIDILIKIATFDKEKAEKRKHVLEGIILILNDIDKAIDLIKNSYDKNEAINQLKNNFNLDEEQANAILEMKLARLTKLDKDDLLKELEEKKQIIAECIKIITDDSYRNLKLIEKITDLKNKYGDERRTVLDQIEFKSEEKEIAEVEPEKCVVVMTQDGFIKRVPISSFRVQNRNGKGVKTQGDITLATIRTNTIDQLMIFTDKGKMYKVLVNKIPEGNNTSKGQNIRTLISIEPDEKATLIYSIYRDTEAKYVLFATKKGMVKKTTLEEYLKTKKRTGMEAIKIKTGDALASVVLVKDENIILLTKNGKAIRIDSNQVAPTSRATAGVKGMTLPEDDELIAAIPVRDQSDELAIFAKTGLAKKIKLSELSQQNRGGKGLIVYKKGEVINGILVSDNDSILIIGNNSSLCVNASEIPSQNRGTIGIQMIKGSTIESVSKV